MLSQKKSRRFHPESDGRGSVPSQDRSPHGVRREKTAALGCRRSEKVHAAKAFTNRSADKGTAKAISATQMTR